MRRLLKECDARLASLSLPDPFSIQALVTTLAAAQGRSIRLMPVDDLKGDLRAACGLRVRDGAVTYVLYRPRPTPHQTEHMILHGLAHEWLNHGVGKSAHSVAVESPQRSGYVAHGRSRYESREEREAEISAYLIKHRAAAAAGTDLVSRLESSLSRSLSPQRRRPLRGR